ncbi:NACHT domain-containing protein [Streptomyces sp. NPDC001514]
MDQARVIEVWVPSAGRVGSGYLLAERLVLTSYHVVQGLPAGGRVEVRPLEVPQRTPWLAASLCWPQDAVDLDAAPEQDAALLVIDDPPGGVSPLVGAVRFGQITGPDRVSCTGLGFPDAEARPGSRRDTMPVRGHVDALQGRRSGMLTVHVDEGIVPRRLAGGSGWAGSSGTALFCGSLLVGVLAIDHALADDASVLRAVPITALAGLPGFDVTLTAHGVDLQLEHASPAARQLAVYLAAARRAATQHPYAGVLPGTTPPLAVVYLRQQVRRLDFEAALGGEVSGASEVAAPANDVLADPETCVILSGPGGGKSSLLRTRLADGVKRWQEGRGENLLPILVPAAALARPTLTEALAAAVTADLGLLEKLPATFFETPPRPGARWLVLVDGLDEVADPVMRGKVLGKVAMATSGEHAHLYRFIIATRPLPDGELGSLGKGVPRYELQPFDHDDLETVARSWFSARPLPDPAEAARRFVQTLDRSQLAELARVPLMTAMLCQLHADAPEQPVPASRGQIYHNFTILLRKSQPPGDTPGVRYPGLESYGSSALTDAADTVLEHLQDLIAHLAAERYAGSTLPALTIVQSQPEARCPKDVLAADWHTFLTASLRRSGLLTTQAGELVFLHQTLLEHLAARQVMNEPRTGKQVLRQVFHHPRRYHPFSPRDGIAPCVWGRRYWDPPYALNNPRHLDPSYVGFLLDAAHDTGLSEGAHHLSRLTRGRLYGLEYIVTLHRLGTYIPSDVLSRTVDLLYAFAHETTVNASLRRYAAEGLAELGDPRGADLLLAIALGSTTGSLLRVQAAEYLGKLGDPRAADTYLAIAQDTTVKGDLRGRVTRELAKLGDPRTAETYLAIAQDTTIESFWRVRAAEYLGELGNPRTADAYLAAAQDSTVESEHRVRAVKGLAALGDPRAADTFLALAQDTTVDSKQRVEAVEELARDGDPRAADIFLTLSQDTTLDGYDRLVALQQLSGLGSTWESEPLPWPADPRTADAYLALAQDTTLGAVREIVVRQLARLGDPRAADAFLALAQDTALGGYTRFEAAQGLARLGDPRAADLFFALTRDSRRSRTHRSMDHRRYAAQELARLGDPRGTKRPSRITLATFIRRAR